MRTWQAAPHQYGTGKRHIIDEERDEIGREKTMCGKCLIAVPGKEMADNADCIICLNKHASKPIRELNEMRWAASRSQWEAQQQIRDAEKATKEKAWREQCERENREWRAKYNAHLRSDKWRGIRTRVLKRSGGFCEGCGIHPAAHVHHLDYKHMGDEFLWELRAVCVACHGRAHPDKEIG